MNDIQPKAVTVHLLDLFTGEKRDIEWKVDHVQGADPNFTWHRDVWYFWFEGNWSCDCNRWPWWMMAGGMTNAAAYSDFQDRDRDAVCGEPRIRVKIELPEPQGIVSDWPADEADREKQATALKESRAKLYAEWDKQ